jgi:hypothetical protein
MPLSIQFFEAIELIADGRCVDPFEWGSYEITVECFYIAEFFVAKTRTRSEVLKQKNTATSAEPLGTHPVFEIDDNNGELPLEILLIGPSKKTKHEPGLEIILNLDPVSRPFPLG